MIGSKYLSRMWLGLSISSFLSATGASQYSRYHATPNPAASQLPSRRQSWHGSKSSGSYPSATYLSGARSGHNLQQRPLATTPELQEETSAVLVENSQSAEQTTQPSPMTFDTVQEALDWMARGNHGNAFFAPFYLFRLYILTYLNVQSCAIQFL